MINIIIILTEKSCGHNFVIASAFGGVLNECVEFIVNFPLNSLCDVIAGYAQLEGSTETAECKCFYTWQNVEQRMRRSWQRTTLT